MSGYPDGAKLASWNHLPTELLRAELARRLEDEPSPKRPACGSNTTKHGYNTPAHVAALFIILALSTFACAFPIIVRRFPSLPVPHRFLFLSRHFGTGVLIATAFVHLLPTAFVSLHDPCLPLFWSKNYTAAAGLIAMVAMLVVVGIEMFFATRGAAHSHGSSYDLFPEDHPERTSQGAGKRPRHSRGQSFRGYEQDRPAGIMLGDMDGSTDNLVDGRSPSVANHSPMPPSIASSSKHADFDDNDDSDLDLDELDPTTNDASNLINGHTTRKRSHSASPLRIPETETSASQYQAQKKALLQVLLLEAGILFHSIFIGMALSVAMGTSFVVLLVAISFHQTFEGFALGARISAIHFPAHSVKPWLMALAYGATTPIGQAIGLMIHNLYDPFSQTGLLMVGVMNAISSGMLLYAGLVTLLAEDLLSDESYESLKGRKRIHACAAVVGGAGLMALVGAWA
ncbi:Zinc/iron permease [Pseudovirgaria hyperparasitica]|uniref:Zinc/iron permease n=1 Tax=Pseudovirgaria hyperparasitica TaxID=470096 RepID=A0A6A6W255_9PEZI|nr:Zinc/iron permease [Pseudovirgaria hyperparasitica]KAF2756643.1 Zinc/iron permease [Pseudovirgaria hyperparasitica]